MKESYNYKKSWQEHYAKQPYGGKYEGPEITPEKFADSMMETFKASGILDLIKKERVSMLASSVSTGKKDWEFLKRLDGYLGKLKKFHRPFVTLTDYALKEEGEERKTIIEKPEQKYKNLDARIVACDSYHLPFKENEFQVLYERLGALWHAADEDDNNNFEGELVRTMLEEYKRVVKPNGKIIFDYAGRVVTPSPTAKKISWAVKKSMKRFFEEMGFEAEVVGKEEKFLVLTNPDKKPEE